MNLSDFKIIVVKIGSSLLLDPRTGAINEAWFADFIDDVVKLAAGRKVVIVSSGAVALGNKILGLDKRQIRVEDNQAAAAVGQIALARAFQHNLASYNLKAAQLLLTLADTEIRRSYLNIKASITSLLTQDVILMINQNDAVLTETLSYGSNDLLAARIATMIGANCLILLSDVDGLYNKNPINNSDAEFIAVVPAITPAIMNMAGDSVSGLSLGGMKTKIEAAKIAMTMGVTMIIACGRDHHSLRSLVTGRARHTLFTTKTTPKAARKAWIINLVPKGHVKIDDGAVKALYQGRSLLCAGVKSVNGNFARGDAIIIKSDQGVEVGCGLSGYDSGDALKFMGLKSEQIERINGFKSQSALIHRDDMVVSK